MSFVEPELIGYQPMVALNDFSLRTDKFHFHFLQYYGALWAHPEENKCLIELKTARLKFPILKKTIFRKISICCKYKKY